jgi:hypothetical protein
MIRTRSFLLMRASEARRNFMVSIIMIVPPSLPYYLAQLKTHSTHVNCTRTIPLLISHVTLRSRLAHLHHRFTTILILIGTPRSLIVITPPEMLMHEQLTLHLPSMSALARHGKCAHA